MSEHSDSHAPAAADPPFRRDELAQFDADDAQAGRAIGRMLASFFLYTVFAMSVVAYWTYRAILQ